MECSIWYPNSKKWYIKHDKDCFIRCPNSEKRYIGHLKDCFVRLSNSEKWCIKHEKECFIRHDHPNSGERYITPWQSWILDSRLWIPDSTFWIPKSPSMILEMRFFSGIPDSLRWITDSKAQDITNRHNKASVIWYPAGTEKWSNTRRLEMLLQIKHEN